MARSQLPDKKLRKVRQYAVLYGVGRRSKGTLKAQYGKQQKVWRIAYVANGQWQLERFRSDDDKIDIIGGKRSNRWQSYQRPTTYEIAKSQLDRRDIQASA